MTAQYQVNGPEAGNVASGFVNRTDSTIAWDAGTRTFTIDVAVPGGSFSFFVGGFEYVKSAAETFIWADTEGLWFLYYDGAGVLQATQNTTVIDAVFTGAGAAVAAFYWDATNNLILRQIDERHGIALPGAVHIYLHKYLGTAYESGGALGNFTIVAGAPTIAQDAAAQFSVADTVVSDEDLRHIINDDTPQDLAPIAELPVFYLSGATPGVWRRKTGDAFPIIYSGTAGYVGANGRLPYNQLSAGNWLLTEVANADFVLLHVFATTDLVEPIIGVQGQATYTTLADAREGARTEINAILALGALLSTERRALGTVIYQSQTAAANAPKAKVVVTDTGDNYVDWRSTPFFAGIVGSSASNPVLAHLADGTTVVLSDLVAPPGVTSQADGVHVFEGQQTNADVALGADGSLPVFVVVLAGLAANRKYSCTVGARVRIWQTGTQANSGSIDLVVDLYITTDGASVATCTVQTTPFPDRSRLPAAITSATATLAASAGGFTISASRRPGGASTTRTKFWVVS